MGYTGFRIRALVKPEYEEEIELLHLSGYNWAAAKYDFLKDFAKDPGSRYIPHGLYRPVKGIEEWNKQSYYSSQIHVWSFTCFLDNYNMTIESFLDNILSKITKQAVVEYKHENSAESIILSLENNFFVPQKRGVA